MFCFLVAEKVVNGEHEIKGKVVQVELEKVESSATGCRAVLVSGLPKGVTENNVYIYFQKKKNGGGEVEKVEMLEEGKARVVFEKPEGLSEFYEISKLVLTCNSASSTGYIYLTNEFRYTKVRRLR